MTSHSEDAAAIAAAIRVRLRRDPGDELLIDGKPTTVKWSAAFMRLAPGIFAEVVLDLPTTIQTFPMESWAASPESLLEIAWRRTLNCSEFEVREVECGLPDPLLVIVGEAPYVTAFAMDPCSVFRQAPDGPKPFAALVAVPTPDYFFLHCFMDDRMEGKDAIAARIGQLASQNYEACEEKRRISPFVYVGYASKGISLEKVGGRAGATVP